MDHQTHLKRIHKDAPVRIIAGDHEGRTGKVERFHRVASHDGQDYKVVTVALTLTNHPVVVGSHEMETI